MTQRVSWLLVVLLAGVFLATAADALRRRADSGKGLPTGSVYSSEGDGLGGAAQLLQKLGWEPVALTRPVGRTHHRGLLILAEPTTSSPLGRGPGLEEGDARSLLLWVEAGNTLLFAGRHTTALHEMLEVAVQTDESATEADVVVVEAGDAVGYTEEVRRVAVEGHSRLTADRGLPLWWDGDRPAAAVLKRGKGRVVLLADASPLTGRGLRREDNAVFLYNVARRHARDGKVFFDEYHHGLESGGGVFGYLAHRGAQWVFVPLLAVVVAAVWRAAVRLGPAVPRPDDVAADAIDYASAVARIYERAGVRRLPARALVRGFLEALTRHLHLRKNALPAEVLAAWRQQHPGDKGERLQTLLRGASELRKGDVAEAQLLKWTRAFDAFRAAEVTSAPRA